MFKSSKDKKEGAIFDILFWGIKNPNKITLQKTGGQLKRSSASEKFIKNEWQKRIASGLKRWPNDILPSRYHFNGLKITDKFVKISADPAISYRDVIGSRPDKFKKSFKGEYCPVPITTTMVISAKNKNGRRLLALTLRNTDHDSNAGGFHATTGGAMEIRKDKNPIDAALRETEEEIGIKPEELSNISCRAINYNPQLSEIGIVFTSEANIAAEKILSRPHDDENKIIFIPIEKDALEHWLLKLTYAGSSDGLVGMLAIGEDLYGKKWKDMVLTELNKKGREYANPKKYRKLEKVDIKKLKIFLNRNSPIDK